MAKEEGAPPKYVKNSDGKFELNSEYKDWKEKKDEGDNFHLDDSFLRYSSCANHLFNPSFNISFQFTGKYDIHFEFQ